MKKLIIGMALCAAAFPALAQTNVGISVGQPGFYGQINVGDFAPRPVLYAPQPVIVERGPRYIAEPIYLRVPPGHRMHWSRFCGRYGACGRPVLFVRDEWYTGSYVPAYRRHFGPVVEYGGPRHYGPGPRFYDHGPRGGWDRGHGEWRGHEGRGEWHGRGEGHGGGHGGGHGEGHGRGW